MTTLDTDRTEGEAGHLTDHDELHRLHNVLDGSTPIFTQDDPPDDPTIGDLWIGPAEGGSGGVTVLGPFHLEPTDPLLTTMGVPLFTPVVGDVLVSSMVFWGDWENGNWSPSIGPAQEGDISTWINLDTAGGTAPTLGYNAAVNTFTDNIGSYQVVAESAEWRAWATNTPSVGAFDVYFLLIPADGSGTSALQRWTGAEWEIIGIRGPAGPQGAVGGPGAQGPQGAAGTGGAVGPQGAAGGLGPQGPQGDVGATGPQGAQGAQGSAGPQGAIGPQGAVGTTGAAGPQGPQGSVGTTGAQGPQGAVGTTGAVGPQGPQGTAGAAGAQGAQGPQGAIGTTGPQGPQGAVGPQGAIGPQGPAGPVNYATRHYARSAFR